MFEKSVLKIDVAMNDLLRSGTIRGGTIFLFGGFLAHLFYYVYRLAMGRLLSPPEFGEVVSFLSLMLIVSAPVLPLQMIVARIAAQLHARGIVGASKQLLLKASLFGGIVVTFLVAGAAVLGISVKEPWTFACIILFVALLGVSNGILQGLERFSRFSLLVSLDGFLRFGFGVLFVLFGFRVAGALAGVLIALAVVYILALVFLRDVIWGKTKERFSFDRHFFRHALWMSLGFLGLHILLNADILLVKYYFTPQEAGMFSAFATLGKAVFLFGMLLAGVLFPIVVRRKEEGKETYKLLWIGIAFTAGLSSATTFVLWLFPRFFIWVSLGEQYLEGSRYLGYYGGIMGLIGLIFLLSYFFMAQGRFSFVYILLTASVLEIFLVATFHESFQQVLLIMFVVAVGSLAGLVLLLGKAFWAKQRIYARTI
ncbi:MAG TPA: oligosaccharide flippase family protein [Candidatus Paceibacterota bacterium]